MIRETTALRWKPTHVTKPDPRVVPLHQMSRYIGQYVSTCDLCLRTKPWQHSPVGELQPLSVPDAWWDTLSIDFVVELPESSGHDAVMTVIDAVSKRVYFIPTHTTVTAEGAA